MEHEHTSQRRRVDCVDDLYQSSGLRSPANKESITSRSSWVAARRVIHHLFRFIGRKPVLGNMIDVPRDPPEIIH